jgi:hypothetical protein
MDTVQFGKFAVIIVWHIGHQFLFCLLTPVPRVHEKKSTLFALANFNKRYMKVIAVYVFPAPVAI